MTDEAKPVLRETMWATLIEDPFSGQPLWLCSEEGNRGEDTTEPVIELAANTFPIGTHITISEPDDDAALSRAQQP